MTDRTPRARAPNFMASSAASRKRKRDDAAAAPSDNPTRPEVLAALVAKRILEGTYRPGDNLREIPLADDFEASRSSVREALRILERDGVVKITPRQGAAVTRLTTDELLEIYQVRSVLLGLAMAMMSTRRESGHVQWLRDRFAAMESTTTRDARQHAARHAALSAEMARYVIERSGNRLLATLLTRMSMQIARYTLVGLSSAKRRAESIASWRQAIAAIASGDFRKAERIGRKLVQDNLRYTIQQLAQIDG